MGLTEKERKFMNKADQKLRGARKDIRIVLGEDSNSNKSRRQETADSDECLTEVPPSELD